MADFLVQAGKLPQNSRFQIHYGRKALIWGRNDDELDFRGLVLGVILNIIGH